MPGPDGPVIPARALRAPAARARAVRAAEHPSHRSVTVPHCLACPARPRPSLRSPTPRSTLPAASARSPPMRRSRSLGREPVAGRRGPRGPRAATDSGAGYSKIGDRSVHANLTAHSHRPRINGKRGDIPGRKGKTGRQGAPLLHPAPFFLPSWPEYPCPLHLPLPPLPPTRPVSYTDSGPNQSPAPPCPKTPFRNETACSLEPFRHCLVKRPARGYPTPAGRIKDADGRLGWRLGGDADEDSGFRSV